MIGIGVRQNRIGFGGVTPPTPFDNTYSLDFDGVDDYVDINTTAAALNFPSTTISSGSFTISFWYKFGSTANFDAVIDNSKFSTNGFGIWQDTTNDNLNFWVGNYSTSNVIGGSTLSSGTWYNITCVFVGGATHTLEIFIDGVSDGTASYTATKTIHTGRNIIIGDNSGTQPRYIDATLDELAIWDSDQSANVGTIYGGGSPINLTSLSPLAWYRMGDSGTFFNSNWEIPEQSKLENWSSHSMEFDGVDDYVDVGNDSSLVIPDTLTVSCWVKTTSTANEGIVYKGALSSNGDWAVVSNGGGTSYIRIFLNNGNKVTGTTQINDGDWHHIAFTYDSGLGSNNLVLYVDGASDGTANFTTSLTNNDGVKIGYYYSLTYALEGNIDEVSVYNVAKSAAEISTIFNSGVPKDESAESGLVGYWRMGEDATWDGSDWTIPDASTNSNDGTSDGMAIEDKVNNAPGNINQGLSSGMVEGDRVTDVP